MKIYFILLISALVLTLSSCEDCPVRVIEVPVDTLKNIPFKHNLQASNFMKDTDTLKIEILDTNVANSIRSFGGLFIVEGVLTEASNFTYEMINPDLFFARNPNKKNEFWIWGFQANIDSTRTYSVGRFDNYYVDLNFSLINEYYRDKSILLFVESTTE